MKSIPIEVQDAIVERIDIVAEIGKHVELKPAGPEFKGLSPLTDEKTPSFCVNPHKKMWFDFSSGKHGNIISFHTQVLNKPFRTAILDLAREAGVDVREFYTSDGDSKDTFQRQRALHNCLELVIKQYRKHLLSPQHKDVAIAYLKQRGLTKQVVTEYQLGYAPGRHTLGQDATDQTLLDVGVAARSTRTRDAIYPRFRNRLIFPIRDARGRAISLGGRLIGEGPGAKYLNGPETELFKKSEHLYGLFEALQRQRDNKKNHGRLPYILVGEGYMDAATPAQHGIDACAVMSATATPTQIGLLQRHAEMVLFCVDGDAAGRRGMRSIIERTLPLVDGTTEFRFVRLPEGTDPDSICQNQGGEALRDVIRRNALRLSDAVVHEVLGEREAFAAMSLERRARRVIEHCTILRNMPASPFRDLIEGTLAEAAGVATDTIQRAARHEDKPIAPASVEPQPVVSPDDAAKPASGSSGAGLLAALRLSHEQYPTDGDPELEDLPKSDPARVREAEGRMAEILRRSPALRAAQIALHFPIVIEPWDVDALAGRTEVAEVRGGALLRDLAALRAARPEAVTGSLLSALDAHEESYWLEYITRNAPRVDDAVATRVFNELLRKVEHVMDNLRMDQLLTDSAQRELTADEERELLRLTSADVTVSVHAATPVADAASSRGTPAQGGSPQKRAVAQSMVPSGPG